MSIEISEDDKKLIFLVFSLLDQLITSEDYPYHQHVGVARDTLDKAKTDAIRFHIGHLKHHKVHATSIDPYKIVSWYGFYVAKNADDVKRISLLATIELMRYFLSCEINGITLDRETTSLLYRMVANDGVNDDHGVGKNGLYLAFLCSRKALLASARKNPKYTGSPLSKKTPQLPPPRRK